MVRNICAERDCTVAVRKNPGRRHSERPLSVPAEVLARERDLLKNHGHVVVCHTHRKAMDRLLATSAPQLPVHVLHSPSPPLSSVPDNAAASPPSSFALSPPLSASETGAPLSPPASGATSSTSSPSAFNPMAIMGQNHLMALLALVGAAQTSAVTPALTLRTASLPLPTPVPHPPAMIRHLKFTDLGKPEHPYTYVVHPHHQPRSDRTLTGPLLEERQQARRDRPQWRSKRAEREGRSFERQWSEMERKGGNGRITWPLVGMHSILEKTTCCSWDEEDAVRGGRQGCQQWMKLVGMNTAVHDC